VKKSSTDKRPASPAQRLASFLAKFDPALAKLIRSCRTVLRKRLPTAIELVYDNYNFLAIGYSPTERTSDTVVSLAASAKGVALSFYHGASLPNPHSILQGSEKQNRFVRVPTSKTLNQPDVEALLRAAVSQAASPFPSSRGYTVIKSVSAKQRTRR